MNLVKTRLRDIILENELNVTFSNSFINILLTKVRSIVPTVKKIDIRSLLVVRRDNSYYIVADIMIDDAVLYIEKEVDVFYYDSFQDRSERPHSNRIDVQNALIEVIEWNREEIIKTMQHE